MKLGRAPATQRSRMRTKLLSARHRKGCQRLRQDVVPSDQPRAASCFAESITSDAMWLRLEQLCRQSPRMKFLRGMLDRAGQIAWLHTLGVLEDDQLMSMVPAFPPYW